MEKIQCKDSRPTAVCGLFNVVDRILKRRGDKRKVFEAANLTIEATRHPLRSDAEVRDEAKALICGRSWVYQRNGRLDEAMVDAKRSLDLGEKTSWNRNTAFCYKCMGRIFRMLAEEERDATKRMELIKKSVDSLREAVKSFTRMDEFGADHPEVGDCYSLVARTYLVVGDLRNARSCLRQAGERLHDVNDKDYLDYLILQGDYATARGEHEVAMSSYDKVIDTKGGGDCEKSEIRARALHKRAECRLPMGEKIAAMTDFESASSISLELNERRAWAKSKWRRIVASDKLTAQEISYLDSSTDTVKVLAIGLHESKMATTPVRGSRRSKADKNYWEYLLREAREQDARQDLGTAKK